MINYHIIINIISENMKLLFMFCLTFYNNNNTIYNKELLDFLSVWQLMAMSF